MTKYDVLFLCQGNLARSQMAEGFYNTLCQKNGLDCLAISAGTLDIVTSLNSTHPCTLRDLSEQCFRHGMREYSLNIQRIIRTMREQNIDITRQKVKTFTSVMTDAVHTVLILCAREYCPAYVISVKTVQYYELEDPFRGEIEAIHRVRDQCKEIAQTMYTELHPA